MAISTDEKVDFLWKKIVYGMSKTASTVNKAGSNESIPSPVTVFSDYVWTDAPSIPLSPPSSSTPVVEVFTGANRIAMTADPTAPLNQTWLATLIPADLSSRAGQFIPPGFGSGYAVKVYIGDPDGGPAARIYPEATAEEWVFDYAAGVVTFPNSIPADKPASIGSGTVSVAVAGIYIEVYQYIGATASADQGPVIETGFDLPLGGVATHGDGSWTPGALPLTDSTRVSEAIDQFNELFALLIPTPPPAFPNATALTITNTNGSTPRLASGVTDNSGGGSGYTAGAAVTRISAAGVSSNTFNDMGPGKSGTVALLLNGSVLGQRVLNGVNDNGSYSGLVIADQKDYPVSTPGFFKSLDISVNLATAPVGINKFKINHTEAGATSDVFFVRDATVATPAITSPTVTQAALGTVAYSSSVPHYNAGAALTVGGSISNLAGETYYGGTDPLSLQGTNAITTAQTYTYVNLGITTPIARQTTGATPITPVTINIDGTNVHASGVIQGTAKNVNGASTVTTMATTTILVKRGTASAAKVDEMSVPVTGLGTSPNGNNAVRVTMGATDTPTGSGTTWDPAAALATHEATVVGGVLKHDVTDYSAVTILPQGPDLSSGRSGAQYATFKFARSARSAFKINITGSYAGCMVKLPGVSDTQPNAVNGWWNAFQPYDGAGVPGEAGDTLAGCATGSVMNGASGSFQITFGTQSSTNATNNEIIVRLKLTAGQQVTALSFSN